MKTRSGVPTPSGAKKETIAPVRGKSKSGKNKRPRERAAQMVKSKSKVGKVGASKLRESKKTVKELSTTLKDEINGQHAAKLEREATNRVRKAEQAKKAELVQKVTNSSKIRRTKKKALRKSAAAQKDSSGAGGKRALRSSITK